MKPNRVNPTKTQIRKAMHNQPEQPPQVNPKRLKWATIDHDTLQRWVTDPNRETEYDEFRDLRALYLQMGTDPIERHMQIMHHAAMMNQAFNGMIQDSMTYALFSVKWAAHLAQQAQEAQQPAPPVVIVETVVRVGLFGHILKLATSARNFFNRIIGKDTPSK